MITIHSDQDWLDLAVGQTAIVKQRLTSVFKELGQIVFTFVDWDPLIIETPYAHLLKPLLGSHVELEVTRTEDGLTTTLTAVNKAANRPPPPAPVYLHLFHGRDTLEQDMEDWGTDGPVIGPLYHVHTTYSTEVKFATDYDTFTKWFPTQHAEDDGYRCEGYIPVAEGLLFHDGVYYGDWSVSTSATG